MAQLKKMRLAVCGLARNCASKLPATIRFVETLSTYFESTIIAVVENDSKDKTRSILKQLGRLLFVCVHYRWKSAKG